MKNYKIRFIFFITFIILGTSFSYEQIPENITKAFKIGNSGELAKSFNSNIQLIIFNNDAIYSKAQAELIVKDFFQKNKPYDFVIIQQEFSKFQKFAIGRLISTNHDKYRVFFTLQPQNGAYFINQLRIEIEED